MVKFKIPILLMIKSYTLWCIERLSTSSLQELYTYKYVPGFWALPVYNSVRLGLKLRDNWASPERKTNNKTSPNSRVRIVSSVLTLSWHFPWTLLCAGGSYSVDLVKTMPTTFELIKRLSWRRQFSVIAKTDVSWYDIADHLFAADRLIRAHTSTIDRCTAVHD